jgi:Tol biopolymer transport system component
MRLRATFVPLVVTIGVAAAVSVTFARQDSPQHKALFEKAKFTMETKGDLQGAIALFEEIIKKYPNEQEYAAQALLQIGLCYEKLGVDKAREAYQRLIKDYPGQTASVATAQERLDGLLRAASLAKKGEREVTIRKIPTPDGWAVAGAVSPDGKYFANLGEKDCELRITGILTGRQRVLTTGKPCSSNPRWSADSTKLVVARNGLDVISLDGSAPRPVVVGGAAGGPLEPLDWSPDQKLVLAILWPRGGASGGSKLVVVAVADGAVRTVKSSNDPVAMPSFDCRFSPDGLTIACSRPPGPGGRRRDVFLLSADGSRETPLVQHPADDALVAWLPDGRGILFASDRAGTYDLWSMQIDKGQPQGAPTLVRRSIGPITPMRLTKNGALYYRTPGSSTDVYTASLDPKTGQIIGPLRKEPLPWEGHNGDPDWSPDARRLAYMSFRPTVVGPFDPGRTTEFVFCIYSADTGKVREFRDSSPGVHPRWSPDGRYVFGSASWTSGGGIRRMDVETGEVTPFLLKANGGGLQLSADGQWVVYCRDRRILRRNAQSGEEKELDGPDVYPGHLALSRDGSRLAWVKVDEKKTTVLKVMSFPDGTPKEIQRLKEPDMRIAWSPDGKFIYYSDQGHLWRVFPEGGDAQDLGSAAHYHSHLSMRPDGTSITFSTDTVNPEPAQLWVMENFLPAVKR